MANPQDPGTFEQSITSTLDFDIVPPRSGDTGDFEASITATLDFDTYVAAPPAGVTVNLNAATLSAAGQAVAVSAPVTVNLNAAALSASGQAVSVSAPSATTIPSGVICIWPGTHASIPDGWDRVTALDGLHPKGAADATDPGGTGGALTHQHTTSNHSHTAAHVHTVPTSPAGSGETLRDSGSTRPPTAHTHASNPNTVDPATTLTDDAPSTDSPNHEPPYFVGIFIESDGTPTGFPSTAIIPWDGASAPSGWTFCDGGGSTPDLRGKYIKGAAALGDGGGSGGNLTHSHTVASHTHGTNFSHAHPNVTSAQTAAGMVGGPGSGGQAATALQTHQHTLVIGTQATDAITGNTDSTNSPNHEPPYVLLGWIQNTSGVASYPDQSIALWIGTLLNIPDDWALCNGTGNVDTRSKFVKGATTLAGVGGTGGSLTHSHTATGHTHAVASHAHTVTDQGDGAGSNNTAGSTGCSTTAHTHPAWSDTGAQSFTSGSGTPTINDYTDTQPPYYAVAWIQYTASVTPTTVTLNAAALSAGGQATSVSPGAVSVTLVAATMAAGGQVLTVVPGAVSILFSTATLTVSGQASTIVPGEASSSLSVAALAAQGQSISILPGAVSSSLTAAVLAASGQVVTVSLATNVFVDLLAANLSAQGQTITVVPGDISQLLSAAALSALGQTVQIVPGDVSVILTAATLTADGQVVTVSIISGVLVNLNVATLASQGQALSVVGGPVSSSLLAATLTATGQTIAVVPGAASFVVSAATLLAQGQVITSLGGPISSTLNAASITAQGQPSSIVPGTASIVLNVAALTASGQVITISAPPGGLVVDLLSATLTANGQIVSVVPGAVSTILDAAVLTAQGQPITMGGAPVVVPVINFGGGGGPFTRPDYEVPYDMDLVIAAQNIIDEEEILLLV